MVLQVSSRLSQSSRLLWGGMLCNKDATADRYKCPDKQIGCIYKCNLKIVLTTVHLISVSTIEKWMGETEYRKEENIGKTKSNLAGLGTAHQAIAQQAIALEAKEKHHSSEKKRSALQKTGTDGSYATNSK